MGKKRSVIAFAVCVFAIFCGIFLTSGNVSAASGDDLQKKAIANNLGLCYTYGFLKGEYNFDASNKFGMNTWSFENIIDAANNANLINPEFGANDDSLKKNCKGLFDETIPQRFKVSAPPTTLSDVPGFLDKIGYVPSGDRKEEKNFCLNIRDGLSKKDYPDAVCWEPGQELFNIVPTINTAGSNFTVKYWWNSYSNPPEAGLSIVEDYGHGVEYTYSVNLSVTDDGKLDLESMEKDSFRKGFSATSDGAINNYQVSYSKAGSTSIMNQTYILEERSNTAAYNAARKNWLGLSTNGPEAFSSGDIVGLYMSYLNKTALGTDSTRCSSEKPAEGYYLFNSSGQWCEIVDGLTAAKTYRYAGFQIDSRSSYLYLNKTMSLDELLNDLAYWIQVDPEAAKAALADLEKPASTSEGGHQNPPDLCYKSAGAMGWVLCPAVVATSGIGQTMWDEVKKNLQFDASVLNSGDKVEQGWMAIRDIANTVFIILFLVVIFSQLTGVGIDNYGIKKILPKLIIIAILINLSFVLCRVFVDVSNIAGVGLENLFKSIAPEMPKGADGATDGMLVGGATGLVLAGIGIGAIFVHLQGMNGGKELLGAAAIGILGAIIVVLVGILTIFLILAIRKAGIVLLTVLSPLAIVCYALPNTEKISKKWLDAFKALLIVYPICGAMVGAGEFAKVVLYNVDPLLSMMASVVPYFFVPVLLKNSLNAIGNIGGKLSAFGRGLGKRGSGAATGAIRNSEKYKDWAAHQKEMREQYRARRIYNGLQGKTSRKAKARATKMAGILAAGAAKEYADERGAQASSLEAMEIAAAKKSKEMEVENQMALVNNKTRNGEEEELLNAEFDEAVASGNKAKAIAIARIAGRRADTARAFVSKKFSDNAAMESNPELFRDIAKEITTGVNSANYRQSSPFDFEYASLLNKNGFSKPVMDENGKPVVDGKGNPVDAGANTFSSWKQSQNNTSAALDHHVAKAPDLMAMKTGALDDIIQMRRDGHISDEEFTRIQGMARDLIQMHEEHRDNGTFDTTKAEQIKQIAAGVPVNIKHQ